MIETMYADAIANMDKIMDEVVQNRDVVIIHRTDAEDVALIAADELRSLLETAHLLRSPKNAERLLTALARGREQTVAPQSVDDLRRDLFNNESDE